MWKHNRPNLLLGLLYLDTKAAIEPGQLSRWCATYNLCKDSSLRLLKRSCLWNKTWVILTCTTMEFHIICIVYICMVVVLISESKYFGLLSTIDLLSRALESFTLCGTSQAPENNCCNSFNWVKEPEQFVHYDEQQCLGILTCKKYSLAHLVSLKL